MAELTASWTESRGAATGLHSSAFAAAVVVAVAVAVVVVGAEFAADWIEVTSG